MYKKILSFFTILFIISAIAAPVYADQTVFGPEDLTISNLYVHLSLHPFSVDEPSDGVLTIVKNTPDKEIAGGFCFLNGNFIGLSDFLTGTSTIFEKDVDLLTNSRITIFFAGTPDSSIKIEIKKKGVTPPPEVTLSADPSTMYVGQSSTLSWTSTHSDTCVIQPGIGNVDVNGSTAVSPTETTTYTITATGTGGTATASATVTLANSAPVAHDQTVSLNEDETAAVTLTASDANGDALTYQIVIGPSHGSLTGTAPNLTYTPSSDYNGSDTFTFKASDGSLDSNTATVTLLIQPVNDPPTAGDDVVTTNEDTPLTAITVLSNDTDPDGDTLGVDDFTQPAHGTTGSNGDGTLTYTPDENFNGTDSFNYTISDGNGGMDTATVNITINPVNDAPVANSQSVTLNEDETASITLTASDADGDTLTYQIVSNPSHGTLTGTAPDLNYTPNDNYHGSDFFTFRANDGTVDSGDATVTITINPVNDPPVADAGPNQTALQGSVVTLNGSGSSDIDGDTITYSWTFVSVPTGSTAVLSDPSMVNPTFSADLIGTYEVQLIVSDGTIDGAPDTVMVNIVDLPTVEITAGPTAILTDESSTLTWTSTYADTCVIEPGIGSVALNGSYIVSPTETTTYTITATNPGGAATASATVTVNVPPAVSFSASPATIAQGGSATLSWSSENAHSAHIDHGVGSVSTNGTLSVTPEHTTTYTLAVTGSFGSASAKTTVKVTGNPAPQPEGSFGQRYEDLIPPDSTVDEYDPKRFSLITGIVHAIDDSPIQDVSITIHSHPEYGTILTDTTGRFSIPVEGGATMRIVYRKEGFITSHRKVYVPWNDIAITETIQMIAQDPVSTTFTFDGNANTIVTHQSTEVTDEFGSRSCSMVFTGDNSAWLVDENGNDVHQLETITVRASEFTTIDSMPAVLPPTSAYTYCVELAVDGADRVRFEKSVVTWVQNFLGFDVGIPVPVGFYDRDRGVWVPLNNGVVVKLLDMDNNGIVDALDADGDDQPDDLNQDGMFNDEIVGLTDNGKYAPDTTFWRAAITHFSPCDFNWPSAPPNDATNPNPNGEPTCEPDSGVCFIEGTLVKTANGLIPIEKIAKGDHVFSHFENKKDTILRKVSRTFVTRNQTVINLKFNDENSILETIGTTVEHPFWIKNRGWVTAEKLKIGDKAYSVDGKWIKLAESKRLAEKQTVYNIEVEDSHTYFVGKSGLLVHNACIKNVNPRKRTLDKDIDLPGTGMTLHYASDRVEGYKTHISVPTSGSSVPASLKQIVVKAEIAGRTMIQHLDPLPDQIAFFEWDGLDYLERPIGSALAKIHIGFVYDALYSFSFDFAVAFGQPGEIVTAVASRNEITFWQRAEKITVHSKNNTPIERKKVVITI
ncbi:MAG: Ig-like domain-containing protein [Thermodesulfobacteriota bacterium]|nr:Ig-like domain-containing protein [Thermodesulfobacteriota bacterium]